MLKINLDYKDRVRSYKRCEYDDPFNAFYKEHSINPPNY